jgi:hypothetical protein
VDRRAKVELFEQIRREYEHGGGTIRGIAKKLGIHRRMVREAVLSVVPLEPKPTDCRVARRSFISSMSCLGSSGEGSNPNFL